MHYLETLNPAQRRAAEYTEGPLLILAGAGAGKTKTLTHRIFNLVKKGVHPGNILAVTFTNKAAKEMKNRVVALMEKESAWQGEAPFVSTFHALGVYILRQEHEFHKRTKYFTIADQKDAIALIKESVKELGLDPKIHEPKKIKHIISAQKNNCRTADMYSREAQSHFGAIVSSVWIRYEEKLAQENSFDFDDLLSETVRILEGNDEVQKKYNKRWKYVHIDEYQDTNESQYRITQALSRHRNLCVVGDGDQTIYTWRGADVTNILNFEKDYEDALVVLLEQNYRSTQKILAAANAVIRKNEKRKDKKLFTHNKEGENILIFEAINDRREAEFVRKSIEFLVNNGAKYEDFAILYRANFQSRLLEEQMLFGNIPYMVLGTKFFDRKEVKDVLSYLRAAFNPDSLSDIKRTINTPKRGIGKVTIAKLFAGNKEELSAAVQSKLRSYFDLLSKIRECGEASLPSETVRFIIEESGLKADFEKSGTEEDVSRIENMEELITFALKYDGLEDGIQRMIEDAALASDQDSLEGKDKTEKPGVKLMTVHSSKGLEFPYVFVVGMEQDLFPHSFDGKSDSNKDDEEERRLFYVAITRAEEQLFLSHAAIRYIHGEQHFQESSEFLKDIPDDIVDVETDMTEQQSSFGGGLDSDGEGGEAFEYLVID